jgi:hypothetical protein
MLITQAEFSRRMNVSRKTVSIWKSEERIVMVGDQVDEDASRLLLTQSSKKTRRRYLESRAKVTEQVTGNSAESKVTVTPAVYEPPASYGNPGNLPDKIVDVAMQIDGGAADMAWLLVPHLPISKTRQIVDAWTKKQRGSWAGGFGLPTSLGEEDDWPPAPIGCAGWFAHPLFTNPPVTEAEWREIEAGGGL